MRLRYILILSISITALSFVGCKPDEPKPDDKPNPFPTFTIPTYADDYSSISSWANRNKWNLANVHDPSVAYYKGYYYMYGTDASYGNAHDGHGHFQGKRSTDLVNWDWVGGPFYQAPTWVADSLNAIRSRMGLDVIAKDKIEYGYWAPVVRRVNVGGQEILRMYYSIVIFNYIKTGNLSSSPFDGSWTERSFIGMCESTDPAGAVWTDKGFVTTSSSDRGKNFSRASTNDWSAYFYYNAIDPTYIVTPEGKHYLIHGSWHSGFALLQLDATTGKPINKLGEPYASSASELTTRYGVRIGTRTAGSRWQGSEAPEIIYNPELKKYFLFVSYDPLMTTYNIRVGRSDKPEGPFLDFNGKDMREEEDNLPILTYPYQFKGHKGWAGTGHNSIFQDKSGAYYLASQARLSPENHLMDLHVRRVFWTKDGWPVLSPERYAGTEQMNIRKNDLAGEWEVITIHGDVPLRDLEAGQILWGENHLKSEEVNRSVVVRLSKDYSISGEMTGKWTFENGILKLNTDNITIELQVFAGQDWEYEKKTLLFTGLNDKGYSLWGKRIK